MKEYLKICLFFTVCKMGAAIARDSDNLPIYKDNAIATPCLKLSSEISSQSTGGERSGWSIFLDQDFLAIKPGDSATDDHNYTMGVGLSNSGTSNSKGILASSRNWLDENIMIYTNTPFASIESMHTTSYGMSVYTPDNLENKNVIEGDRPYASLLYISNTKMTAYINGESTETTLMVGVLGLDVAKEIQQFAHNELNFSTEDPLGWGNQISDGGEVTALYTIEKKKLISNCYAANKAGSDISYTMSADVGYMVNAAIGMDFRWGYIGTPYYLHSSTPVSNYNYYSCYGCRTYDNYLFLNFRLRAIVYNALLQGQFRDSRLTIDSRDIENIGFEASLGWVYSLSPEWKLTYSINYKSNEFKGSKAEDYLYGGLYLSNGVLE